MFYIRFVFFLLCGITVRQFVFASTVAEQYIVAQTAAAPAATQPSHSDESQTSSPGTAPDAPVITITGLCDPPPSDKAASVKAAKDCRTVITRAEFEKTVQAVQPSMTGSARRQFAVRYTSALVMAQKAQTMGLDQSPSFQEHMRLARIQVLSTELTQALQESSSRVSDQDIEDQYNKNRAAFEEADVKRIFIPRVQQMPTPKVKLSDAEEQKRTQDSENTMKVEADTLRARAVAGEDFDKLQGDAFGLAGIKSSSPNTSMGVLRRDGLPPSQSSAMDLKPGEISSVLTDPSGYFIYKITSRETKPLRDVREEIRANLAAQRMRDAMRAVQESAKATLDDTYFGPAGPQ